jgi:hypothetical protein
MIDLVDATRRMRDTAQAIAMMVAPVDDEQARWKPASHRWSILEIMGHLADEERHDFRQRLDMLLHDPSAAWPAIDPETWVRERQYNSRLLEAALADFLGEREKSLSWLATLSTPDWNCAYHHAQFGDITAGTLMTSWLAHDVLHIRQLAGLQYAHLARVAAPHTPTYAGAW